MSAHTRTHPIKQHHPNIQTDLLFIEDDDITYAIPREVAEKYIVTVKKPTHRLGNVSADKVFADLEHRYTKAGALLKGTRAREGLSQVKFAEAIGVTQANLSKMENGKRPIGKTIAKRIEKVFGVNYRYFLE